MKDETKKLYSLIAQFVEFVESPEIQKAIDGANDPDSLCREAVRLLDAKYGKDWRQWDQAFLYEA